jgi:hypothetical protein
METQDEAQGNNKEKRDSKRKTIYFMQHEFRIREENEAKQ